MVVEAVVVVVVVVVADVVGGELGDGDGAALVAGAGAVVVVTSTVVVVDGVVVELTSGVASSMRSFSTARIWRTWGSTRAGDDSSGAATGGVVVGEGERGRSLPQTSAAPRRSVRAAVTARNRLLNIELEGGRG